MNWRVARGGRIAEAGASPATGVYRAIASGIQTIWWEGVGTVLARGEP